MSNKIINIKGISKSNNQFVVQSQGFNINISNNVSDNWSNDPSPEEFLLAGFAGSINAVGKLIAEELGIKLESLLVEISGELETKKSEGIKTRSRAGFSKIEVVIKPVSDASLDLLKKWLDEVKERCPLRDNLINTTPVLLTLLKEYKEA
ncbi:OsmC family protein [Flavobacterium sp.]|uniref:OsmC family protein n=1 Tax=Flavobacterium sp. TaxID=239 RepID=UPI00260AE841|nr:OsmC family protein [Flavobacterium sp.]